MSQHNELAQYPKLLQSFNIATGLKENEEGVVRIGETLTPTIDIWNGRREWALLRGEQWYSRRINVGAGGGGTNGGVGLGNPTGSGIVAVLAGVTAYPSAATQQLQMWAYTDAIALANFGAVSYGVPMDRRRVGLLAASQAIIRSGGPVGIPAGGFELEVHQRAALETYQFYHLPQMLYPGDAIMIIIATTATAMWANLVWYERKCVVNEARG